MLRIVLCLLGLAGCADDHGPRLVSAEPPIAGRGTQVVLRGERLCGDHNNCDTAAGEIDFGVSTSTVRATVIDYQDTSATIMVPLAAEVGATAIVVVVNERSSNALDFEVLAPTANLDLP